MTKDEALKLALSTLDEVRSETFRLLRNGQKLYAENKVWDTVFAIKEVLAQPEQEPVAYGMWDTMLGKGNRMMMVRLDKGQDGCTVPLYTTPPQPEEKVDWEKLYRLEVKKKDALAAKYERDIKPLTKIVPMAQPEPVIDKSAAVRIATALGWEPKRKPLTDEQIMEMYNEPRSDAEMIAFARAIEAAHGIWPENSDCHGPDWTDRDGEYLK